MSCLNWISDLGDLIYRAVAHVGKGARLNVPAAADIPHAPSAPSDAPRSAVAQHYGPARAPGPLKHVHELLQRRRHHLYDVLHPPSVLIAACALALSAPASLGLVHLLLPALTPLLSHQGITSSYLTNIRIFYSPPALKIGTKFYKLTKCTQLILEQLGGNSKAVLHQSVIRYLCSRPFVSQAIATRPLLAGEIVARGYGIHHGQSGTAPLHRRNLCHLQTL